MDAQYNLWLEKDGIVVMSLWRSNFLKAITATRSLKAAADQMSCSYHEAQLKLDEMETGLGYKLVTYIPCDEGKDEIQLTAEGEKLLRDFEDFSASFEEDVRNKMREKFK